MLETHVVCLICGHRAETLARHLKAAHDIPADTYREQFPGARIRSEQCEANRSEASKKRAVEHPTKGKTKVILCSACGTPRTVGWSFAPATHETRCNGCVQKDEEAKWGALTEGRDYVVCQGCRHLAENLTSHIQSVHPEWVGCYPGQIVADCSAVRDKSALKGRKHTPETIVRMKASAGWNRGLTKETDERVAHAAEAMKGRTSWSKGLTKEDHPSLRSTSEKLSVLKTGVPNDAARLDLSTMNFTPYLDETGAVDRKLMAEELGISEPTITKYMGQIGLRLSTKYVDARVERDVETGRFHDMSRVSNEPRVVRLTAEQLEPYRLKNGKVLLGRAMAALGHGYPIIKRECDRLGLPTHTHLVRQIICLDAVANVIGVPYQMEWKSKRFINPLTGHRFKFDGFFALAPTLALIVEFHGYQHWTFPNVFHRTEADFQAGVERDREKERQVREDGTFRYLVFREDEPYTDPVYIRERYLDEID